MICTEVPYFIADYRAPQYCNSFEFSVDWSSQSWFMLFVIVLTFIVIFYLFYSGNYDYMFSLKVWNLTEIFVNLGYDQIMFYCCLIIFL